MTEKLSLQAYNMVMGQLMTNEVLDPRIWQAMAAVPREDFVPSPLKGAAYVDEDLDIGGGRALMAPMTVARLLSLAAIEPAARVLNIGALNGYYAALLARLATHVTAIETDPTLLEQATAHLARLKITNVTLQKTESLADGFAASAPYDVIFIAGGMQFLPDTLAPQLALGGRLVAVRYVSGRPGAGGGLGRGMLARRVGSQLQPREYFDTGTTLLPGFARDIPFAF